MKAAGNHDLTVELNHQSGGSVVRAAETRCDRAVVTESRVWTAVGVETGRGKLGARAAGFHDLAVGLESDVIHLNGATDVHRGATAGAEFCVQAAVGIEPSQPKCPKPGQAPANRTRRNDPSVRLNRNFGAARKTLPESDIHAPAATKTWIELALRVESQDKHVIAVYDVAIAARANGRNLAVGLKGQTDGQVCWSDVEADVGRDTDL